jgi:GDPmannose 4,6-dehydratase
VKALITGACGQDGWYLSEFLVGKGYEVVGTRRGNEEPADEPPGVQMVFGDVSDALCMRTLVEEHRPDEVYNLAAITHVGDSFSAMAAAFDVNAVGTANCLDAAARIGAKFYQASTSELFGDSPPPQREDSPMRPRSPYACAKLAAYWLTRNYRERGMHAVNGILFNHESVRRGGGFVTQKVARAVAAIKRGTQRDLVLGNLDAARDWGHARDYVRGMWMLMQQPADDYVLATGQMRTVRDLCEVAFTHAGLDYREHVRTSEAFRRPLEVERLCGDARKANAIGWWPQVTFEDMIREMVDYAIAHSLDVGRAGA